MKKKLNGVNVHYLPTYGFVSSLPISPNYPTSIIKTYGDILHIHQPFPLADLTLEIFPKLRKKFFEDCNFLALRYNSPKMGVSTLRKIYS